MLPLILNPRFRSLRRGTVLVLAAFVAALFLTDFPNNRQTVLLIVPAAVAVAGLIDHVRCMQTRWSWYHGGVLLLIYMDLMVVSMILFFLFYPSLQVFFKAH